VAQAKKKPRALKCAYRENGQRCPRTGEGNPPLCRAHLAVFQQQAQERPRSSVIGDVINRFSKGQKVSPQDIVSAAAELFAGLGGRPQQRGPVPPWWGAYQQTQQQQQRQQPPPPQPPGASPDEIARARKILGFKPSDVIDANDIKKRHRKLVLKLHPDRPGGDAARMAEVNNAVDILSAAVA
jgi:hypothetical protein